MLKFYRIVSIASATIGTIGYAILLYLHGTNNMVLREPVWEGSGIDVHISLMAGSFVWVLVCAFTHSLYLYEKNMRYY